MSYVLTTEYGVGLKVSEVWDRGKQICHHYVVSMPYILSL
nr:MAG TPA: hypothetical protein [Bacteriophage sp.]